VFPLTASAAAYSFAAGTSRGTVLQAFRPPASTGVLLFTVLVDRIVYLKGSKAISCKIGSSDWSAGLASVIIAGN